MRDPHSHSDAPELVLLFPGQGSQHYQMARELFDADPVFRDLMTSIDAGFAAREGVSLLSHLYGSQPLRVPLDDIRLSHPLLVLVEYCLACMLRQRGLQPVLAIGCSAGEFAAHAFAGRITIETALDMMARQAQWACAHVEPGFMLAVMAPRSWCEADPQVSALAGVAGVGMASATVLSGARSELAALEALLRERGVASHALPVRVPFHGALVEPLRRLWMQRFGHLAPPPATLPLLGRHTDDAAYAEGLWDVIRQPFNFPEQLAKLDRERRYLLVDVGPGGTLANWVRHGGCAVEGQPWTALGLLSPWGGDLRRLQGLLNMVTQPAPAP